MDRLLNIFDCFYFGIVPYFIYENVCHYREVGYIAHFKMNMGLAFDLITYQKTYDHPCDIIYIK